jgi:hypothetical protein
MVISDGQACSDRFGEDQTSFDIILMDFQVSDIFYFRYFSSVRLRQSKFGANMADT